MTHTPGSLVTVRNRNWVVQPSPDPDLLILQPLGGSEAETIGIYTKLNFEEDEIKEAIFESPQVEDLGDFVGAGILRNAARLSFRHAAGPFRSLAKLSFRPRAYQMVPLIMALKLNPDPVRLLIADDVGVGKTVEALIVVKEMLERREIKKFAVICLPHLCDQWQREIKEKFNLDAVIIRSNTKAKLDREARGDASVFEYFPYQVISIDFIKARRPEFVQYCPEMIIIDEAHTCTKPVGANKSQQLRHFLVREIADKENQHLILLTATPHSGKAAQFQSLLGLLKNEFEHIDLGKADEKERRQVAKHYVQRRRADVIKWMDEDTPFPEREAGEFTYPLSSSYADFYNQALEFVKGMMSHEPHTKGKQRLRYWTALALLRGIMSSPAAGVEMLNKRLDRLNEKGILADFEMDMPNPVMDRDEDLANDITQGHLVEQLSWSDSQKQKLRSLQKRLEDLGNIKGDLKASQAVKITQSWLKEGYQTVIFCRYIATAKYVGRILTESLPKKVNVQVVTSEDPDEVRRERIDRMKTSEQRILVATDCLSEGINLQELFTAVLHYDLPWNPNRLEQREGRVDRYGQQAEKVKTFLLYGENNPIDGVVFRVLLKKVREIRNSIGISIPFPEDSETIMDAVLHAVLLQPMDVRNPSQLALFDLAEIAQNEQKASNAIEIAAKRETASRSRFAKHNIKANEIAQDLEETDEAIGNPQAVESFVINALPRLGVNVAKLKENGAYRLLLTNLPGSLKDTLPDTDSLQVSFQSPTPKDLYYLGRNHLFVEQLCQYLLAKSLDHKEDDGPARASVIRTHAVRERTTIFLLRVRNVIESKQYRQQLVAEEMHLWGYQGSSQNPQILEKEAVEDLLQTAKPEGEISRQQQERFLERELEKIADLDPVLNQVAEERAEKLVEAHERFRKTMGGQSYQIVKPVLPMDILGLYVLLPINA